MRLHPRARQSTSNVANSFGILMELVFFCSRNASNYFSTTLLKRKRGHYSARDAGRRKQTEADNNFCTYHRDNVGRSLGPRGPLCPLPQESN